MIFLAIFTQKVWSPRDMVSRVMAASQSERFVFVVGKSGTIVFAKVYNIPTLPDNAEIR